MAAKLTIFQNFTINYFHALRKVFNEASEPILFYQIEKLRLFTMSARGSFNENTFAMAKMLAQIDSFFLQRQSYNR